MKKRRIMAVITSAMCLLGTLSVPTVVFASEVENRDKVYDDSLVLPEETIRTDKALRSLLWDSEKNIPRINAYTALAQDKRTIEVHSVDADVLETVKAFVKEKSLNEELIIYILDDEEEQLTDGGIIEGDANCDNEVNMADAVIIMQSLANPDKYTLSERGKKNADTNKDGITNTDALNIQKHLLGL